MVIVNMDVEKMGCYHMKLQCTKSPILALFWPRLHLRAIGAYQDVGSLGLSKHAEGTDHLFMNPMYALGSSACLERPGEPTSW